MRARRTVVAGFVVTAALALSACSQTNTDPGADATDTGNTDLPVIGSTTYSRSFEFYQDIEAGMEDAAGDLAEVVFQDPNGDLAEQTANIESFISSGVDLITIVPIDSDAAAAAGRMAVDAGIPLITVDIAITEDVGQVTHIASDNLEGGRIAARKMAELLDNSGEVVIINNPAITSVVEREQGFVEELAKIAPDITVVASQSGDSEREKAQSVAEDLLQAYPDASGIFAVNDEMALGALQAVEAAGRGETMSIIGFDASSEGLAEIEAGSAFKASVAQDPVRMGQIVMETALKVLAGETVDKLIPVPVKLVDASNYQEYMK